MNEWMNEWSLKNQKSFFNMINILWETIRVYLHLVSTSLKFASKQTVWYKNTKKKKKYKIESEVITNNSVAKIESGKHNKGASYKQKWH